MTAAIEERHVPAWQRLGLKLKLQEQPPKNSHDELAAQKKRKSEAQGDSSGGDDASEKPVKKARISKDRAQSAVATASIQKSRAAPPARTSKQPSLPRKSVSFSLDTKTEDASSAKDLYKAWIASQKASDPSFDPSSFKQDALKSITPPTIKPKSHTTSTTVLASPTSPSSIPAETPNKTKKKKKKKKRNKSKSTALPPAANPPTKTSPSTPTSESKEATSHPALTYLTTHHTAPSAWKFSKSRSSYLLRHLFSLTHIPPSYNEALQPYLSGLQGQNVKRRLAEQASQIRTEDDEWLADAGNFDDGSWNGSSDVASEAGVDTMDNLQKRRELFARALAQHEAWLEQRENIKEEADKDRVWREKVERRRRAEMVLGLFGGEVAHTHGTDEAAVTPATVTKGQKRALPPDGGAGGKAKPKRKRKRRTTGVADDESSSSSPSSSSSSSSGGDSTGDEKPTRAGNMVKGRMAAAAANGHVDVDLTADDDTTSSEGDDTSSSSSSSGGGES